MSAGYIALGLLSTVARQPRWFRFYDPSTHHACLNKTTPRRVWRRFNGGCKMVLRIAVLSGLAEIVSPRCARSVSSGRLLRRIEHAIEPVAARRKCRRSTWQVSSGRWVQHFQVAMTISEL